ncbi:MAG: GNAT family N-acetyltransferase [Paraclostridium sp.]
MRIAYSTEEQIKDFNYKLYLYHKESRDIDFEFPKLIEVDLKRENMCIYDGDELLGFISFDKINSNYIEIKRMWVEKSARRKRVATQMINLLFYKKFSGTICAKTYTFDGIKFFLWNGFKIVGINKNGSINVELEV